MDEAEIYLVKLYRSWRGLQLLRAVAACQVLGSRHGAAHLHPYWGDGQAAGLERNQRFFHRGKKTKMLIVSFRLTAGRVLLLKAQLQLLR